MPALYSHLTLLQQASRSGQPSMDQQNFQEAKAAGAASASPAGSDVNSVHAAASVSSRPPSSGGASYSSAGETQARPSGRSDMSQALLFNTAALESNLAAAQRGDAIGFSGCGSSNTNDADFWTSQVVSGLEPTTTPTDSGACLCNVMPLQCHAKHEPFLLCCTTLRKTQKLIVMVSCCRAASTPTSGATTAAICPVKGAIAVATASKSLR